MYSIIIHDSFHFASQSNIGKYNVGFFSGVGKAVSRVFDFRVDKWLDFRGLQDNASFLVQTGTRLFKMEAAGSAETFEEACERLNWDPKFIELQIQRFSLLVSVFLIASFLLLFYAIYIALTGLLISALMVFAIAIFAVTQAFRYHFWKYQLLKKKLGCSFSEWLNSLLQRD